MDETSDLSCPPANKNLLNRGQEVPKENLTSPGRIRYNEIGPRDCFFESRPPGRAMQDVTARGEKKRKRDPFLLNGAWETS